MQLTAHQLGVGFNPLFLTGELPLPEGCSYLEANNRGIDRLEALALGNRPEMSYSLHLARVPFCESRVIQEAFISQSLTRLSPRVRSIGLHLCGPYRQGLGLFGLGTGFEYAPETVESSCYFLERVRDRIDVPILLENANCYDTDPHQALKTIKFANRLGNEYGVRLILDLAHLIMNARNLGLEPQYLLGQVDLDLVDIIHLSGIVEGRDRLLHDSHTAAVHPDVWNLLAIVLPLLTHPVTLVLEHTDTCWGQQADLFLADWERMRHMLAVGSTPHLNDRVIDLERVGLGYMANIVLPRHFAEIYRVLGKEKFDRVVRMWGQDFLQRVKHHPDAYIAIGQSDYLNSVALQIDPIVDFALFLQHLHHSPKTARSVPITSR